MITLHVGNIETDVSCDFDFTSEFIALRNKMSYRPEGYLFSPKYRRKQWDGWKRLIWKNKRCYFPTGLLSVAKQHFDERKIEYQIFDLRKKPDANFFVKLSDKYALRYYQERDANTAVEKSRGIILAATGSGKTILSAGIISKCAVKPFLFLVTSIDLLEQTTDQFESALINQDGSPIIVGQIGAGKVNIQDITVMTVQTAVRALGKKFIKFDNDSKEEKVDNSLMQKHKKEIVDLIYNAQGTIFDECQHVRADMCQIVTKSLKNAYFRWGASATPYRDQGDDLLIQSCFGKNVCEINASELIREGYLIKPEIHFIHINPPVSKFRNWQNIYKEQVVENEYYNTLITNLAEQYIKADRLILILVQQIEHGKTLESMIDGSLFVYGDSPKTERLSALKKLKNRYINCIISSSIFDEGVDCKPLNTLILAGQGKMATRAMQRVGRVLRPHESKKDAIVIDFFIHEKYLENHAKAREKMYKTEEEFQIEHVFID